MFTGYGLSLGRMTVPNTRVAPLRLRHPCTRQACVWFYCDVRDGRGGRTLQYNGRYTRHMLLKCSTSPRAILGLIYSIFEEQMSLPIKGEEVVTAARGYLRSRRSRQ
ncbi:hypothetical protein EVAR_86563_1 [Eumeta japonica]|uniref:Uncharacterized protein n=1 Tax=Eumeta variegata TaxID=151549 RepID=A0A4C2A7I9_EUMVA|nr:hypothetical protein EVAR_86563_1 [Eumeta japonica]